MANDNLDEKKEQLEQLKQEMAKLEAEIVAASQANEIVGGAIKQKALEAGIDTNIPEEIPDYVGEAGEKARELVEKGIEKGRDWLSRARNAINKGIHKAIETAPKVVQAVKDAPKNIDNKIQEAQMAHARDKFEKRKNRKTFTSKVEDLAGVIKYKIKDWKEKGKEDFATNLEISKAYAKIAKDYIKEIPGKMDKAKQAKQMAKARDKFEKRKNRQTFTSKVQDFAALKRYRANKRKEQRATNSEIRKAYIKVGADNIVKGVKTVIKGAKGFVEKMDKAKQAKQMAKARDKFEKRKNRQTFTSKVQDFAALKRYRANKRKEQRATNSEIRKAYVKVGANIVANGVASASQAVANAAVATGTAVVETTNNVKRSVKKASKKYTGTVLSKMANGLGKAIDSAGKLRETMTTKSNQLMEMPDEQKGDENPIEHLTDEEVK